MTVTKLARREGHRINPYKVASSPYERKETYSVEDVLFHVRMDGHNTSVDFDGDSIHMGSQRYRLFKKSVTCVQCGIAGTFFAKERSIYQPDAGYHFNLYGNRPDGSEVMMTKDHIIPKSKGGVNKMSNYQTMCAPCNERKGNKQC